MSWCIIIMKELKMQSLIWSKLLELKTIKRSMFLSRHWSLSCDCLLLYLQNYKLRFETWSVVHCSIAISRYLRRYLFMYRGRPITNIFSVYAPFHTSNISSIHAYVPLRNDCPLCIYLMWKTQVSFFSLMILIFWHLRVHPHVQRSKHLSFDRHIVVI